jgi:hypothetical protein
MRRNRNTMRINEVNLKRIIKESVRRVLREMEEGSPAEKLLSMGLKEVTGKEGPAGFFNPTKAKPYLLYDEPIFYWTIEVEGRKFCAGDGAIFTEAVEASYACDEYLDAIDGANCGAYAEVEGVWLEDGKFETDIMLYFDKYWND